MAKLELVLNEDFDGLLMRIQEGILSGSSTASLEESADFCEGGARCSVRVFERYSALGGNRVSLSVVLFATAGGPVRLAAMATGGSQAMLFKVNTFGEKAFLDKLRELLE